MFIKFNPNSSRTFFGEGTEDHQKRELISIGVRMGGSLHETVELTMGGKLEQLEGVVWLYRGTWEKDGVGRITYVHEYTDTDFGYSESCFQVDLFLTDATFGAILRNVENGRLPVVRIDFEHVIGDDDSGIKFGYAPDGSDMIWDNENHKYLPIFSFETSFELVPEPEEPLEDDIETRFSPSPPTGQQLDKIISEIELLKQNTRFVASVLGWLVLLYVAVLAIRGFF